MGTYRSKEDDVAKISTTVYVTNFPESLSAKELFNSCNVYGHVVDSFIPTKRAKNGKRFGFVRFINVFSKERLVNNLCTVWIDRYKLHANISRFHRNNTNGTKEDAKGAGGNSYVRVLKGDGQTEDEDVEKSPAIVLDDECLMTRDLSKSILGRVKVFASLDNLKMALCNEGFVDIKIHYMGEFWVMMEFANKESIKKFRENMDRSISEEFKIIHRGKLYWIRARETPGWVPDFTEEPDDDDQDDTNSNDDGFKDQIPGFFGGDSDVEEVQGNMLNEVGQGDNNLEEGELNEKMEKSEDPFNIYPMLNKKVENGGNYDGEGLNKSKRVEGNEVSRIIVKSKDDGTDSFSSGHFKKSKIPRTGGSILGLLDEVLKVRMCWGNLAFDYVHSAAVGSSGVILCVWDSNIFWINKCCGNIYIVRLGDGHERLLSWEIVTSEIREWNTTSRSSVTMTKAQCKNDLEAIDNIIDRGNGGEEEISKRVEIINKLHDIDNLQSMEIAQKAKIKWAVEGDENSSFFHGMLNKKRNILNVWGVMVDGVWVDNSNRVKQEFFDHFNARFCQPGHKDASIQMEFPKKLSDEKLRKIKCDVTNDETKRAVYFFLYSDIPKGCNSSFIALIPKIQNANLVKDFRLISLIGSLYKIIAKIMANRLVGVLSNIVNEVQSAFIADIQILDGPFILNEAIQWATGKLGCLVLKTPFFYLGSIVGGYMSRKQTWNDILERVKKRLSKWKMQILSIGGNTLWARVIKAIHGADGRIGANSSVGISSCWTTISQEMNSFSKKGIDLMKYMHIKVGNGDTTIFSEDKWCEEGVLKDRFPRVYALESCKKITVAAKLSQPNFSFSFRRNPEEDAN
nr:nucleotide-binding alpha-beta plait domain-containing protein [Tanacetum cinerariifolium]